MSNFTMSNGMTYPSKPGFKPCEECVHPWPPRYEDGSCWACTNLEVSEAYTALKDGEAFDPEYSKGFPSSSAIAYELGFEYYYTGQACKKGPHAKKLPLVGPKRCIACPRVAARNEAKTQYNPEIDCAVCGNKAPRLVKTDACMFCRENPSSTPRPKTPRSTARHAGHKHYEADTPCPDCDTFERRVYDNKCVHCCSATDSRKTGTQAFIDGNPDLIVDRDTATSLGFKVFRTGEPCLRGHKGYRYVTTNGCITCLRGE